MMMIWMTRMTLAMVMLTAVAMMMIRLKTTIMMVSMMLPMMMMTLVTMMMMMMMMMMMCLPCKTQPADAVTCPRPGLLLVCLQRANGCCDDAVSGAGRIVPAWMVGQRCVCCCEM